MTGWLSQTEVITVSLMGWSTDHNVSLIHFLSNRQPWMDLYSRNLGPFVLYSASHPPDSVNIQRLAPIHDCGKYSILSLSLHCDSLSVSCIRNLYCHFCIWPRSTLVSANHQSLGRRSHHSGSQPFHQTIKSTINSQLQKSAPALTRTKLSHLNFYSNSKSSEVASM